jgi:hypothetical protein
VALGGLGLVNSWPSVTGKIESADVNEPKAFLGLKTSRTPKYFAEIGYSYGVDGNIYTRTNRREFGDQGSKDLLHPGGYSKS